MAVPLTAIPELIEGLDRLSIQYDLPTINFGHAGNGNIHVNLLLNPEKADLIKRVQDCLDKMFTLVLSLGGTLSGEHGVGLEKRDFISRELDANTLELTHAIKRQLDPKGILNPGKISPPGR